MDFRKSEEQELLIDNLRELFSNEGLTESYFAECDIKHAYPEKMTKVLLENGYTFLGLPEEYGGTPCDNLTQIMIYEEIARLGAPVYAQFNMYIALKDMIEFGTKEQMRLVMDIAKTGTTPLSLAITEPQAGSDTSAIATTATRKNGKVYINGHKTFITGAGDFPYMLCVTRDLDNPKPHKAMSMWLLRNDAPGITMRKLDKIGTNTIGAYEVYLENVEIDETDLVGAEGNGFMQMVKNFEFERLVQCSYSLGWAEAAFEDAVRYAGQRVQFGQSIGSFQLIQKKISDMALKIENMRNILYKTSWELDNNIPVQISSALTKLCCVGPGYEVLDDALQIFGGIGYTNDLRIQRLWRDSRLQKIAGGTEEIMYHISSRAIIKQHQ